MHAIKLKLCGMEVALNDGDPWFRMGTYGFFIVLRLVSFAV